MFFPSPTMDGILAHICPPQSVTLIINHHSITAVSSSDPLTISCEIGPLGPSRAVYCLPGPHHGTESLSHHKHTHTDISVVGCRDMAWTLTSHWKGFSPVWVLMCSSSPLFWLKALLHSLHLYGFSCGDTKQPVKLVLWAKPGEELASDVAKWHGYAANSPPHTFCLQYEDMKWKTAELLRWGGNGRRRGLKKHTDSSKEQEK